MYYQELISVIPGQDTVDFRLRNAVTLDREVEQVAGSDLSSAEATANLIINYRPAVFIAKLLDMNSTILGREPGSGEITTVQDVIVDDGGNSIEILPSPQDKLDGLEVVLNTAKAIEDREERALVLGHGINAVHPFAHGNGRTARAAYYLLSRDYHYGDPKLIDVLGIDGDKSAYVNPGMYTTPLYTTIQHAIGSHYFDDKGNKLGPKYQPGIDGRTPDINVSIDDNLTPLDLKKLDLEMIFGHQEIGTTLAYALVEMTDMPAADKAHFTHRITGQHVLLVDHFLNAATPEEIDVAHDIFRDIKIAYVKKLMQQMALGDEGNILIISPWLTDEPLTMMQLAKKAVNQGELAMKASQTS